MGNDFRLGQLLEVLGCLLLILAFGGVGVAQENTPLPGAEIETIGLVRTNSAYALFRGRTLPSDPVEAWTEVGFDDSEWEQGQLSPFSYGEGHEIGTVIEDMQGNYTSLILRQTFQIDSPEEVIGLVLTAAIDDGFIAWINGEEVLRVNVADRPFSIDITASTVSEPIPYVDYRLPVPSSGLRFGDNQLAIQVINGSISSSDLFFELALEAELGEPNQLPALAGVEPNLAGIPMSVFDWSEEWRFFRGSTPPSDPESGWLAADFDDSAWETAAAPFYYGEAVEGGTELTDMQGNYSTLFLRRNFMVEEHELNRRVQVSALVDDGVAVWINGREVGRASAPGGVIGFDARATMSAVEPLEPVVLFGPADLLKPGENSIAVVGINGSAASSDFFVDISLQVLEWPIIPEAGSWRVFAEGNPAGEIPWQSTDFDDRDWDLRQGPFLSQYRAEGGSVVPQLVDSLNALRLRRTFYVEDPSLFERLTLHLESAHGVVVWLNGSELFRNNVGAGEDGLTGTALEALGEPATLDFAIEGHQQRLMVGANVLAVQAFNADADREGFFFDLSATAGAGDVTSPQLVSVSPDTLRVSTLSDVTLKFSEPVGGISRHDLTVNGRSALRVVGAGDTFRFELAPPDQWPASVVFAPQGPILDLGEPPNFFPIARTEWEYELQDESAPQVIGVFPPAGVGLAEFSEVEIAFDESVSGFEPSSILANGVAAVRVEAMDPQRYLVVFESPLVGPLRLEFASETSIRDAAGNLLSLPEPWEYEVLGAGYGGELRVNEVVSANYSGLVDAEGDPEDWIELFNSGDEPIPLAGWSLTDDADEPRKWVFPGGVLGPQEFLVVFASGKDRYDADLGEWHTNFRIAREGEAIFLYRPDYPASLVSQSPNPLPVLRDGVSFARDDSGRWGYSLGATPGGTNAVELRDRVLESVAFSVGSGRFDAPFQLRLGVADEGTQIRYTIDGSEPSLQFGMDYTGPIQITATTIVRASAFDGSAVPSEIRTESYLFSDSLPPGDLPVFSLVSAPDNILGRTGFLGIGGGEYVPRGSSLIWAPLGPDDYHNPSSRGRTWERPISVDYFDPQGEGFHINGGIRVHGSISARPKLRSDSKFGFRLYFRSDYGESRLDYPIVAESGLDQFDRLVLRSGHNDSRNPFITDELMRRLSVAMGRRTSLGGFSHVYLNGVHQGYYNHVERIDSTSLQEWFGGGSDWDVIKPFGILSEGDRDEWFEMVEFFSSNDLSVPANYLEAGRHLDLESFADYILVNIYGDTGDWVRSNWRAAREEVPDGLFRFIVWDAEFALGIFGRSVETNTLPQDGQLGIDTFISNFFAALVQNVEFRLLFADRVQKHFFNGGALTDAAIQREYERTRDEVIEAIPDFRTHIGDTWIPGRRGFLFQHLAEAGLIRSENAPVMDPFGGSVFAGFELRMEGPPGGEIYYTMDGSDPRQSFRGRPSDGARVYSGEPIVLTESVTVRARSLVGGEWSALVEAPFQVGASDSGLSVTEIHYHPVEGGTPEFVEILNRSAEPLDLGGATTDGIGFEFPVGSVMGPGEVWVIVRDNDLAAFRALYPDVFVVGGFSGRLSNGGENIEIASRDGALLVSVNYNDANGWPEAADGTGPSLELRRLSSDPNDATGWRASASEGGSPGIFRAEETPIVRIEEVFASRAVGSPPAFVDLVSMDPVSRLVAGWTLESLRQGTVLFRFPEGAQLDPGGRITVVMGVDPGVQGGFSTQLSPDLDEDTVLLRDADGLLVDSVRYGDQVPGLSMVREPGEIWALGQPQLGGDPLPEALASPGALRINEWLANPEPGGEDWFEIFNSDVLRPARLQGLIFSDGQSFQLLRSPVFVPAGGFVRLWADNGRGPDHLAFRLAGGGGTIAIYSGQGELLDQVSYEAQVEGQSVGLLPDGSDVREVFSDGGSPGASNGPQGIGEILISEVLWQNESSVALPGGQLVPFVEILNRGDSELSLSGFELEVKSLDTATWVFPDAGAIPAGERRVVWLASAETVVPETDWLFAGLDRVGDVGGRIRLRDDQGNLLDEIEFGQQLANLSLGWDEAGWQLRERATPGGPEAMVLEMGVQTALRVNEWVAASAEGVDWIELFNTSDRVVGLDGLVVTDDPSVLGRTQLGEFAHTFVGPQSWVVLGDSPEFPVGAPFQLGFSLARSGESIRVYAGDGALVDAVDFGQQVRNRSEGRVPDGTDERLALLMPTPGRANDPVGALDADRDGLADDWERANGLNPADPSDALLDADGDGLSNLQEFIDGTNPRDLPELIVGSIRLEADQVVMSFTVLPMTEYQVETKDDLNADWEMLMTVTTGPEDYVLIVEDSAFRDLPVRFYRVVRP